MSVQANNRQRYAYAYVDCQRSFCGDGVLNKQREECDRLDIGANTCATYKRGSVLAAPLLPLLLAQLGTSHGLT